MEILKWQKLGSRYLVKEKWATLRVDTCKLQNGTVKDDYYVLEYPDWANAIALTKDNKILMVRQYRHAGDIISLELPGGVVDAGEAPEEGIRRELREETGYTFGSCERIATLFANPATANNRTYTYLLKDGVKTQDQELDEHEILQVEEYTIAEVKAMLAANQIDQALHAAALLYGLLKIGALQ